MMSSSLCRRAFHDAATAPTPARIREVSATIEELLEQLRKVKPGQQAATAKPGSGTGDATNGDGSKDANIENTAIDEAEDEEQLAALLAAEGVPPCPQDLAHRSEVMNSFVEEVSRYFISAVVKSVAAGGNDDEDRSSKKRKKKEQHQSSDHCDSQLKQLATKLQTPNCVALHVQLLTTSITVSKAHKNTGVVRRTIDRQETQHRIGRHGMMMQIVVRDACGPTGAISQCLGKSTSGRSYVEGTSGSSGVADGGDLFRLAPSSAALFGKGAAVESAGQKRKDRDDDEDRDRPPLVDLVSCGVGSSNTIVKDASPQDPTSGTALQHEDDEENEPYNNFIENSSRRKFLSNTGAIQMLNDCCAEDMQKLLLHGGDHHGVDGGRQESGVAPNNQLWHRVVQSKQAKQQQQAAATGSANNTNNKAVVPHARRHVPQHGVECGVEAVFYLGFDGVLYRAFPLPPPPAESNEPQLMTETESTIAAQPEEDDSQPAAQQEAPTQEQQLPPKHKLPVIVMGSEGFVGPCVEYWRRQHQLPQ